MYLKNYKTYRLQIFRHSSSSLWYLSQQQQLNVRLTNKIHCKRCVKDVLRPHCQRNSLIIYFTLNGYFFYTKLYYSKQHSNNTNKYECKYEPILHLALKEISCLLIIYFFHQHTRILY